MMETLEVPQLFEPHPNFSDAVNSNIIQSEIEGGVYLRDLPLGAVIEVETRNRSYVLVNQGDGEVLISGHPEFCPEPVLVKVNGSTWGGSMLLEKFIGRGMHLEFWHPDHSTVTTSKILDVRAI